MKHISVLNPNAESSRDKHQLQPHSESQKIAGSCLRFGMYMPKTRSLRFLILLVLYKARFRLVRVVLCASANFPISTPAPGPSTSTPFPGIIQSCSFDSIVVSPCVLALHTSEQQKMFRSPMPVIGLFKRTWLFLNCKREGLRDVTVFALRAKRPNTFLKH